MPGSAGERRDWGRRRARAWFTPTWRAPGGPRHWPCRRTCHWWPASTTRCPGRPATTRHGPGMRHGGSTCSSPRGPSARAWAARIGLDDGRLRDGRSSVEGLSAAALPGFPSPRLTFADRLRGDKAPDVLIEILALIDAPPPAYLVGDGPLRGPMTRLIRARGLEAVVHLPGWSYEPARDIAQATVYVVPHARSRGRKAPCWPWGSASRSSAPRSTAWRTLGEGRGVLVPAAAPRALAGALSRVLAASAPTPPSAGPAPAVHSQRSGRGTGQRLPPAARQPRQSREASRAMALKTSAFWCRSWSWAAVLTEMAAPAGRQVTALPHSSERTAGPAPGTSASRRDDSRSARLPLVTARDGSSVRKGADPPSSCSSGYCHRSLTVAAPDRSLSVLSANQYAARGRRSGSWLVR
jgi:hypothetical protein